MGRREIPFDASLGEEGTALTFRRSGIVCAHQVLEQIRFERDFGIEFSSGECR